MSNAITKTSFKLPGQTNLYVGKVRDVYHIKDELLIMVTTDRISAFDVVLPGESHTRDRCLTRLPRSSWTQRKISSRTGK